MPFVPSETQKWSVAHIAVCKLHMTAQHDWSKLVVLCFVDWWHKWLLSSRIAGSMWVHERPCIDQTMTQVPRVFHKQFNKGLSWSVRLLDWERCIFRWMCWGLNVDRKTKKDTGATTTTGLSPRNWCGNNYYSLVYYGEHYSIAGIVSHITWLSQMNSWMLTWIHCLTLFWMLQPTWILCLPMSTLSYYHWKEYGMCWVK